MSRKSVLTRKKKTEGFKHSIVGTGTWSKRAIQQLDPDLFSPRLIRCTCNFCTEPAHSPPMIRARWVAQGQCYHATRSSDYRLCALAGLCNVCVKDRRWRIGGSRAIFALSANAARRTMHRR